MTLSLIFNADDYGRTRDVSRGIRDAHLRGLVTSTTCMMNLPGTADDIRLALDLAPALGLGVHLTLTADSPLLPPQTIPTLCDSAGNFLKLHRLITSLETVDVTQVKAEWRAQIEAFCKAAGRNPTHLDSHHHSSYFTPAFFRAMLELADEYECAIRLPVVNKFDLQVTGLPDEVTDNIQKGITALIHQFAPRTPDGFLADFYDKDATAATLLDYISARPEGTYEIMCHPGYNTPMLEAVSSYNRQRENELSILTGQHLREEFEKYDIRFATFENFR